MEAMIEIQLSKMDSGERSVEFLYGIFAEKKKMNLWYMAFIIKKGRRVDNGKKENNVCCNLRESKIKVYV